MLAVGWCQPLLVDAAINSGRGVEHYRSMCRPIVVSSATSIGSYRIGISVGAFYLHRFARGAC